jgi:hypothetical protein
LEGFCSTIELHPPDELSKSSVFLAGFLFADFLFAVFLHTPKITGNPLVEEVGFEPT